MRSLGVKCPSGIAVDANDNLFVADSLANTVVEIPSNSGSNSSSMITVASGFNFLSGIAVDGAGRVYVVDLEYIWVLTPQ
jgi:DNA-binding beta-propeller fold protein YncE